jgi:DGQHR domain-containing protein
MAKFGIKASAVAASPELQYVQGGLMLKTTAVPYFATSMNVQWLAEHLRLPADLPVDPSRPLDIEELFQRELNKTRVREEIFPYLQQRNSLRFFNALTVVLLPLDPDSRYLMDHYPSEDLAPRSATANEKHVVRSALGPIQIVHPTDDHSAGLLNWNTDLTAPIVLDGQHRFAALRLALESHDKELAQELRTSDVPVLFTILDKRVGFKAAEGDKGILPACRSLFIFLNKHAKTVTKVRQYLLDDSDPTAVSMRAVIASGAAVPSGDKELPSTKQRVESDLRLPLALIDIRSDTAKVDAGPFITSVLTLYELTGIMLRRQLPQPTDYDDLRAYVEGAFSVLRLDEDGGKLRNRNLKHWKELITDRENRQVPFQFDRETVAEFGVKFRERFGPQLTLPIVGLKPYESLVDAYESAGYLRTKLEPWFSYEQDEQEALLDSLRAANPDMPLKDPALAIRKIYEAVKKEYRLAYQVVFQRAFVIALHQTLTIGSGSGAISLWPKWIKSKSELTASSVLTRQSERSFVEAWIGKWNQVFAEAPRRIWEVPTIAAQSPFFGTGIRIGGEIDFRKPAADRIASFVGLAVISPLLEWREEGRGRKARARTWVQEVFNAIGPGAPSGLPGLYSYFGTRWRRSLEDAEVALDADRSGDELNNAIVERAVGQLLALI